MSSATPGNCDLRGLEACLYINYGTLNTPVWSEHLGITGDLTVAETEDEEELTTRNRNRQVKEYIGGDTDLAITGTQVMDSEYIGWQYLYSMRGHSGAPRDVMFLTEPISNVGAVGWRGMMRNFDRTFNAPTTGAQNQNFNLRPAACTDLSVRPVKVAIANTAGTYDPGSISFPSTSSTSG